VSRTPNGRKGRWLVSLSSKDRACPADELKDFLKDKVKAAFWIPDEIIFLKEMPKTSVGKFNKRELRKLYADHQLKTL
jgi:fatty-acyl-CoA synthase